MEFFTEVVGTSIKIYALMTPPAVLSAFISGTKGFDKKQKSMVAAKTSAAIFLIGVTLFLFGPHLFSLFGFTLDAFRIGAGVLLFLTAVSLMNDDGKDALSKMTGAIDMVITDLNMPNLDGIGLIKGIRAQAAYKFIPVVMLTTESQAGKKAEGKSAGATGWIVKPFTPDQLLAVVKKVLR